MSCGQYFGHEDCSYSTVTVEREGHRADRDAYTRSKNKKYKNKIARQMKEHSK